MISLSLLREHAQAASRDRDSLRLDPAVVLALVEAAERAQAFRKVLHAETWEKARELALALDAALEPFAAEART